MEEREKLVLGKPPRIPPVTELNDEMRELTLPPPGYGTPGEVTVAYRVLLNNPEIVRHTRAIGEYFILHGALPVRERELAILRSAWLSQAPYEWGEHVGIGKSAGITTAEVERIVEGSAAVGWSDHERALLRAVEELHAEAMISDPTWESLARTFDDKQLIEITMLVGQYQATAYWLNALRIPLRDGNPGLSAR